MDIIDSLISGESVRSQSRFKGHIGYSKFGELVMKGLTAEGEGQLITANPDDTTIGAGVLVHVNRTEINLDFDFLR